MEPALDEFIWREGPAGRVLISKALEPVARHVFTTRDLTFRGGTAAADEERLARALGLDAGRLASARQVHGCAVLSLDPDGSDVAPALPVEADAIVSTDASRAVLVRVADCVPVLIADRGGRAVAAVHAGWRGTAASVVTAAVRALADRGTPASDLVAAIGPSIGPCCYQVDAPVRRAFDAAFPSAADWFVADGPDRWRLNLWQANADQLRAAGLRADDIHQARLCTRHHPGLFHSYRRDGAGAGRLVAAIRVKV